MTFSVSTPGKDCASVPGCLKGGEGQRSTKEIIQEVPSIEKGGSAHIVPFSNHRLAGLTRQHGDRLRGDGQPTSCRGSEVGDQNP